MFDFKDQYEKKRDGLIKALQEVEERTINKLYADGFIKSGEMLSFGDIYVKPYIKSDIEASMSTLEFRAAEPSYYELESGEVLRNVHSEDKCAGRACAIHHASDHPLHDKPRSWRYGKIYRTCEHGVHHPDFDSLANLLDRQGWLFSAHQCCVAKCCGIPELVEIDG